MLFYFYSSDQCHVVINIKVLAASGSVYSLIVFIQGLTMWIMVHLVKSWKSVGICNCGLYVCCNLQVIISWELHT
jgi:hypothetical protein